MFVVVVERFLVKILYNVLYDHVKNLDHSLSYEISLNIHPNKKMLAETSEKIELTRRKKKDEKSLVFAQRKPDYHVSKKNFSIFSRLH